MLLDLLMRFLAGKISAPRSGGTYKRYLPPDLERPLLLFLAGELSESELFAMLAAN